MITVPEKNFFGGVTNIFGNLQESVVILNTVVIFAMVTGVLRHLSMA